jgi:hypothetical protein
MTNSTNQTAQRGGANWWKYAFLAMLAAIGLFMVVGVAAFAIAGKALVCFGISTDITEYIQTLDKAEFDPALKEEAIERLERLREEARRGEHVGFWRWLGYDESIRGLLADGAVTEGEYATLMRELDRLERTN